MSGAAEKARTALLDAARRYAAAALRNMNSKDETSPEIVALRARELEALAIGFVEELTTAEKERICSEGWRP